MAFGDGSESGARIKGMFTVIRGQDRFGGVPAGDAEPCPCAALFILAHQDDELSVAPLIAAAKRAGRAVAVVYLTDGGAGVASPATRNAESLAALAAIGVDTAREVAFLGERLGIPDCKLSNHLQAAHDGVLAIAARMVEAPGVIFTHAWEGGNPDHDAAHVVALGIGARLGLGARVFQVPFYRATRRGPLPFAVFAPLEANGPVLRYRAGRLRRLGVVRLIRFFPSQVQAFVRLGPFMLIDALRRSWLPIQRASVRRIRQRPMPGPLRYERHGHDTFARLAPLFEAHCRRVLGNWGSAETARVRRRNGAQPLALSLVRD